MCVDEFGNCVSLKEEEPEPLPEPEPEPRPTLQATFKPAVAPVSILGLQYNRIGTTFCCPHCSQLSTILTKIVEPKLGLVLGSKRLFNFCFFNISRHLMNFFTERKNSS